MVTKDGLTVTTSRERLIDAINAAKQQSQSVVDSYEKHKANLEVFDQIMREVNPRTRVRRNATRSSRSCGQRWDNFVRCKRSSPP